ncbi:MAG: AmmeMemoRadiSam system protein B [Acidobacteriota bacterium]
MRTLQRCTIIFVLAVSGCGLSAQSGPQLETVRQSAVAGQFYPESPVRLKGAIEAFLHDAATPRPERPIAIVAPHAGYIYSGQIAADAFRQAAQHHYDTVVIIGTNHTDPSFSGIAIHPGTAFRTPLGIAPIDDGMRKALMKEDGDCTANATVHAREHSVEVQVPFVQYLFPSATIVPVVVGRPDIGLCTRFGRALAKVAKGRQVLIVASSDLSHYPSAANAAVVDRRTLESVVTLDPDRLHTVARQQMESSIPELVTCACGEGPIMAAMEAAVALGANRGTVISYANSADVPVGDASRVVGYGAVVLSSGERGSDTTALSRVPAVDSSGPLQPQDKKTLLVLARESIARVLNTDTVPLARAGSPRLQRSSGVFVTLRKHGELRGCIGQMTPTAPLPRLTEMMALAAAFNDPRFEKVRADELNDIDVEVSVLTPFKPVSNASAILPGRDGVLLRKNGRSAVFLPEVATEQGWNREEMLDNLCVKAGLSAGCWRTGADLSVFQADAFSEKDPR